MTDFWVEGLSLCEVYGSRVESFTKDAFEAKVTYEVTDAEKDLAIFTLLTHGTYGYSIPYPLGATGLVDPFLDIKVYATGVSVVPFLENPNHAAAEKYTFPRHLLTVTYSSNNDGKNIEVLEVSTENQIIDNTKFRWKSDKKNLSKEEAPVKPIKTAVYTILSKLDAIALPVGYRDFVGTVNKVAHNPDIAPSVTFEPETMLYMPGDTKSGLAYDSLQVFPAVAKNYPTQHRWLVKLDEGSTWNKFWKPETESYESLTKLDEPNWKLYPSADHDDLLKIDLT